MCGTILRVDIQDDSTTLQSIFSMYWWHHFKEEELKSVRELFQVCFQIVLKCWYLARVGRPDVLWSVNNFCTIQTFSTFWSLAFITHVAKIMVQYGRPSCSSWTKSVWSSFSKTIMGKAIWENPIETWMGENSKLGMSLCSSWKRIILLCVCGWHKIGWKETKSLIRCGKYSIKKPIWENQHLSLIMYTWDALNVNVK